MNGQHACCPTCTIKERGTENCSKRINLIDFAAESGWQPDALSHVRDYICGNWTTEDVVVQPLIRPWAYSHTQNRVFRGRLKHTHAYTTHTLLHYHPLKHLLLVYTPSHTHAHTHSCIRQVQKSMQYLGGYSREGGTLRDAFGYLQSFYPQGSKHQLLLGRTQMGFLRGLWKEVRPKDERAEGKHTDTWAEGIHKWRCPLFMLYESHWMEKGAI